LDILKSIIRFFNTENPAEQVAEGQIIEKSPVQVTEEHIIPAAPAEEKLLCPACNKSLTEKEKSGIKICSCSDCQGFFMTREDMNYLLNNDIQEEWNDLFQEYKTSEDTFKRSRNLRKCPVCSVSMDNMQFQYSSGIWVDYCPGGHGIWMDGGEMKLIRDYTSGTKNFYEKIDNKIQESVPDELYEYLMSILPDEKFNDYKNKALKEYAIYYHISGNEAKITVHKHEKHSLSFGVRHIKTHHEHVNLNVKVPEDYMRYQIVAYAREDGLIDDKKIEKK
jgi:Zn-finger nucleic acid-binding protein